MSVACTCANQQQIDTASCGEVWKTDMSLPGNLMTKRSTQNRLEFASQFRRAGYALQMIIPKKEGTVSVVY